MPSAALRSGPHDLRIVAPHPVAASLFSLQCHPCESEATLLYLTLRVAATHSLQAHFPKQKRASAKCQAPTDKASMGTAKY